MESVDLIVLGATGFTGKLVLDELVRLTKESEYSNITFGVAGRSMDKINNLIKDLKEKEEDTSQITLFQCDVRKEASIKALTKKAKVLLNVTGPYSTLGEPIVQACIESGTHYVDISAELHHMLGIYRKYKDAAEEANVLIITACGFGSIPSVMGLVHLQKQFQGDLQSVECYTEVDIPKRAYWPGPNKCLVHYGTWASLVFELQNFREYNEMKRNTFPEPLTPEIGQNGSFFHRSNGKLWFPYPGPDNDIGEMTQRYNAEKRGQKPFYYKIYTTMPKLFHFLIIPVFLFYYYASYFKCFRNLLWRFPRLFTLGYMSHKGPSNEMMKDTKFSFKLHGKGKLLAEGSDNVADKSLVLKVSGSDGYGITAIAIVLSAITILKDQSVMPKGGVLTPGGAFYDTKLVDRLKSNGLKFEIIKETNVTISK